MLKPIWAEFLDAWSFGCVLFEMYSKGLDPYPNHNPLAAATGLKFE